MAAALLVSAAAVSRREASTPPFSCDVLTSPPIDTTARLVWDGSFPRRRSVSSKAIEYPKVSKRLGEEGRVLVEFRVSKDGSPTNLKIVRSDNFARLNEQALRILRGTIFVRPAPSNASKVFRETVAFCIARCSPVEKFADSDGMLLVTSPPVE